MLIYYANYTSQKKTPLLYIYIIIIQLCCAILLYNFVATLMCVALCNFVSLFAAAMLVNNRFAILVTGFGVTDNAKIVERNGVRFNYSNV